MRFFVTTMILVLEGIVMKSIGYDLGTWQWWAITLLTPLYAFAMEFLD